MSNAANTSIDLFNSSQEDDDDSAVLCISPPPAYSPPFLGRGANGTPSKKTPSKHSKQLSISSFVKVGVSPKSTTTTKNKKIQSKMDLYVKWKDPKRDEQAQKQRTKNSVSAQRKRSYEDIAKADDANQKQTSPPRSQSMKSSQNRKVLSPKAERLSNSLLDLDDDESSFQSTSGFSTRNFKRDDHKSTNDENEYTKVKLESSTRNVKTDSRAELMKNLIGNDKEFRKGASTNLQKIRDEKLSKLRDGDVVRKKADRAVMHANDCKCCNGYYDALGLSPNSKQQRIQQVSRHRYVENPQPKTPENYWEIGFPSESEQKRRGLIRMVSPKKKTNATDTAQESSRKKLF